MQAAVVGVQSVRDGLVGNASHFGSVRFKVHVELKDAAGNRFICVNESSTYQDIAQTLKDAFPEYGKKIKTFVLPDFFILFYSLFDKDTRVITVELGHRRSYDNSKAVKMFNWNPRTNKEAIQSMGETMIKYGVV